MTAGAAAAEVTRDTLWGGRLVFWQPARGRGYRFNLDPVLLADFAPQADHVLDFGAGVGVLGVLLLASGKARRVTAVEVQPELAALARRNALENGLSDSLTVIEGDCRHVALPSVDAVVFNPPYFPAHEGRGARDRGRDHARHERHGTLADFVVRGRARLDLSTRSDAVDHVQGRSPLSVSAIVPARRGEELLGLCTTAGFTLARRRYVCPRAESLPGHWLLEARIHAGPALPTVMRVVDEAPLVVHAGGGRDYSPEVRRILHEDGGGDREHHDESDSSPELKGRGDA